MTPLTPKDDQALLNFLKTHNPESPRAPSDEIAKIQRRLPSLWGFLGWRQWAPAMGAAAALVVWFAVQRGPTLQKEDEWWIDAAEVQTLIDEEPAAEWASLISSID